MKKRLIVKRNEGLIEIEGRTAHKGNPVEKKISNDFVYFKGKKTAVIQLRLPCYLLEMYKFLSGRSGLSVSELIRRTSFKLFDENDAAMQDDLRKAHIQIKRTQLHAELYIVKNMYKRILDMAMSSYFMTGGINMKAINLSLDEYVKEFDLYDGKIKKAIGTDFKMTVKRLRDQNFLLDQSQTIKKLKMIEGR